MAEETDIRVRALEAREVGDRTDELACLLHACVHAGASINFVLPFDKADAEAFWRSKVLPDVERGGRIVQVAEADGRVVGSVQLAIDMPPNQPHRAELNKLMVHPDHRRRGIARRLRR